MKTRPRPITKLPKLVEIVPDMYPDLIFGDMSWKPLKISEKGFTGLLFPSIHGWIQAEGGRAVQRVTWLTGILSWFKCTYCANGQMTTSKMWHDFVILRILKKEDNPTFVCYFHIIHPNKQTKNQTKYLVPLLLTFKKQEKSIYVPKSIGHFSHFMLPLAECQLNTS